MNKSSKSKKFLGIGVLLGIVSVLGILWRISFADAGPSAKPQPSPTPKVLENGWYQFTDPDAGYSISYPSNSYLSVSNDLALDYKQVTITFPTAIANDYQTMQIIVYANNERLSIKQTIEKKVYKGKSPKKGNDIPLTPVKLSGLDGEKMVMPPFDPAFFLSEKNRIYFISLPYDMLTGNPPTPEAIELFYKIVNTFSIN